MGCLYEYDYTYSVRYEANDLDSGSPPVDNQHYIAGDLVQILGPGSMERSNYTFMGWSMWDSSTIYAPDDRVPINWDITFTAKWQFRGVDYEYSIVSGAEITINKYIGQDSSHLEIPTFLEDLPVTRIEADTFSSKWIAELTLPAQLKEIGENAFSRNNLNFIVIPDSVTNIGNLAFHNNYNLSKVTLGKNLETIGNYAFMNNNLENIIIPPGVTAIGEGAFYGNNIAIIEIGAGVDIKSDTSFGNRGKSFRSFYNAKEQRAGIYRFNAGEWKLFTVAE
jgi:hypothetical protein